MYEWFYRFLKKHGRLNININSKSKIVDEMFKLIDTGKYKKRNLIKALREKFPKLGIIIIDISYLFFYDEQLRNLKSRSLLL